MQLYKAFLEDINTKKTEVFEFSFEEIKNQAAIKELNGGKKTDYRSIRDVLNKILDPKWKILGVKRIFYNRKKEGKNEQSNSERV